ncbi:MAG TPA: hypothetical protein VNJ01_17100 [Bacteriovoracaceae bacterium]|nr:hypothetical protein [Bacteriovoracaceae bacterium]
MFFKLQRLFILAFMLSAISGCGDLLGINLRKTKLDSSRFKVDCELDLNKFSQIMYENIGPQIRCLGENLNLFIRVVKSEKKGYLSRIQLERYLKVNRPDVKPEVVRALKSVFDIGHLITGEDPNFISKEVVDKVINFALIFNEEAALNFQPIFQNTSPVTYALHQNHRDRVSAANKAIVSGLRKIFNPNRDGKVHSLRIIELLENFSTDETRVYLNRAKKVIFAKKVLLGGDKEVITHLELERLLLNFDRLILIGLDAVRYKYIILKQESLLQLLKRDIGDLSDIITQGQLGSRDNEVLFTVGDAIEATKLWIKPETFDIDKYRSLIDEAKKILMGGTASEVKGKELKTLIAHSKTVLQTGTVFHRIYDKYRVALESPLPIDIDFREYRSAYPEHASEVNQFDRIVKKYRFMKGEFISPYYSEGYRRNPDAVFEVALYEYGMQLLLKVYGSPKEGTIGGYSINQAQTRALFKKFEKELIDLKLMLPQRAISVADNVSLLGTLFQYQSDKNEVLDVNEGTEFALSLVTSINVAKDMMKEYRKNGCRFDQFQRVEPQCFRQHFWKGFCTNYRSYFPRMFDSIEAPKDCENFEETYQSENLLQKSVAAARSCVNYTDGAREEIYYSEGDIMTILLGMFHVETTILRWDENGNNYMDWWEVNNAYEIYSTALDGFLASKPSIIRKFKKQIFQYMIKYEQIPDIKDPKSIAKFIWFIGPFGKKKAPAYRSTISSILASISEENKKISTDQQFDCNYLRDPENIPNNPQTIAPVVDTREDQSYRLERYLNLIDD